MYANFTDRARKVMQLANQEAQRFNHEWIGTEHVLLGLAKEGGGIAGVVLKNLGITLRLIREEIEKLVASGPEMVTMGKIPQTPRCRKVLECAAEESKALGHFYIGTEHILLGLLREQEGIAAQVLNKAGVSLEKAKEHIVAVLGVETQDAPRVDKPKKDFTIHYCVNVNMERWDTFTRTKVFDSQGNEIGTIVVGRRFEHAESKKET